MSFLLTVRWSLFVVCSVIFHVHCYKKCLFKFNLVLLNGDTRILLPVLLLLSSTTMTHKYHESMWWPPSHLTILWNPLTVTRDFNLHMYVCTEWIRWRSIYGLSLHMYSMWLLYMFLQATTLKVNTNPMSFCVLIWQEWECHSSSTP